MFFSFWSNIYIRYSPNSLLLGSIFKKKSWPHWLAAHLNSVAGFCPPLVLVLSCCCPPLVLLLSSGRADQPWTHWLAAPLNSVAGLCDRVLSSCLLLFCSSLVAEQLAMSMPTKIKQFALGGRTKKSFLTNIGPNKSFLKWCGVYAGIVFCGDHFRRA